jgi:hypothetical protein
MSCMRVLFMVASSVFLVAGIILTVVSAVFPGWHLVDITEIGQTHQHGLWMWCSKSLVLRGNEKVQQNSIGGTTNVNEWDCGISISETDHLANMAGNIASTPQHVFNAWRRTVVILLGAAFVMAILTLLVSFCGFCNKWFTIGWSAGSLIALLFQVAAVLVYFLNAHDYDNLRIIGRLDTYTQSKGYAFWCACAAIFCYLINFVLTVAICILAFLLDRQQMSVNKTWPKSHTAV